MNSWPSGWAWTTVWLGGTCEGIRAMPDDFPPLKCYAALDKFEEAAQAAAEAEARVWGEE